MVIFVVVTAIINMLATKGGSGNLISIRFICH